MIHPTAIIDPGARIADDVEVGPFTIIEDDVEIGSGCRISSGVRIYCGTRMGRHNQIDHGVVLGCEPQDLSFTQENSKPLRIGDHNRFREGANISRGIKSEHGTIIGSHNYMMAMCHVGHDCIVGDHNIFANTASLSGHVEMEDHIFLSAKTAIHQFCRIGAYSMISGVTGVTRDVPPYLLADGHRADAVGLNVVGLRRAGFSSAQRQAIKQAYRVIYQPGIKLQQAMEELKASNPTDEVTHIIQFIEANQRGIISQR